MIINVSGVGRKEFIEEAKKALVKGGVDEINTQQTTFEKTFDKILEATLPVDVLVRSQLERIIKEIHIYQTKNFIKKNQEIPEDELNQIIGGRYDEFMNILMSMK